MLTDLGTCAARTADDPGHALGTDLCHAAGDFGHDAGCQIADLQFSHFAAALHFRGFTPDERMLMPSLPLRASAHPNSVPARIALPSKARTGPRCREQRLSPSMPRDRLSTHPPTRSRSWILDRTSNPRAVLVFDTATCNAPRDTDCAPIARIPVPNANVSGLNPVTRTVYVSMVASNPNEGERAESAHPA